MEDVKKVVVIDARDGKPPEPVTLPEPEQPVKAEVPVKPAEDPLAKIQAKLDEMEARLRNQDKAIQRKEDENRHLRESLVSRESDQSMTKAMLALLAQQQGKTTDAFGDEVKQNQPNLVAEFERIQVEQEAKRKQEEFSQKVNDYQQKVIDAGLTEEHEDYWDLYDAVAKGQFKRADIKLERLTKKKQQDTSPVVPTPKEDVDKQVEEKARAMVEPMLRTDTGRPAAPSGQTFTVDQVVRMDSGTYKKHFPNGYVDFMQAMKDGKVKE